MMRKIVTILCLFSMSSAFAQKIKQEPEFIGNKGAFGTFIGENYHYPEQMLKANVSGRIFVKFIVTKRGAVDSIQITQSPGFGTDEEITRVLRLSSGKWKPGRLRGKAVNMYYYLPLNICSG